MKNKYLIILFSFLFILTGVCFADENLDIEILFAKAYPTIQYKSITKTDIDGLFEVAAGSNILYYYPKKNYIFFGEIWNGKGKSLTAERRKELLAVTLEDLPLEEALKIGEGENRVIVVTDPDCPFCRKLSSFLSEREDVTSYVYFFPLNFIEACSDCTKTRCLRDADALGKRHACFGCRHTTDKVPFRAERRN